MSTVTDTTGLRERRRLATEAEIEAAAFALFARHSSERTTVNDIAAAAGVSQRTFFRYFATKEDAAFGVKRAFFAAVSDHLTTYAPGAITLADLTAATSQALTAFSADGGAPLDQLLTLRCLCKQDDNLRRAALLLDAEHSRLHQEKLAADDQRSRLHARILVETLDVALSAALDEWAGRRTAGEDADVVAIFRAIVDLQRHLFHEPPR